MGNRAQFDFADNEGVYLSLYCNWDKERHLASIVEIIERRKGEYLFEHVSEIMKLDGLEFGGNSMASLVTFTEDSGEIEMVIEDTTTLLGVELDTCWGDWEMYLPDGKEE